MKRRRRLATLGLLSLGLLPVACSGGQAQDGVTDEKVSTIGFAFAPDPVWDYMKDTGAIKKWEAKHNIKLDVSKTWNKFTYFAGGHGDIVSMGTDELPLFVSETGSEVVAFGKYNHQRVPLYRRAGDSYRTLADVPKGSTICVSGPLSNTVVWSVIADKLHGLNYRVGGGDFKLVVQDHFVMPKLLVQGDCEVAAFIPEAAVSMLRKGKVEPMYNGRQPWQVYKDICSCDHEGIMSNLMVARAGWYDSHKEEARAFLELWQEGVDAWQDNKAEIIRRYPQHFSVKTQKDIEYLTDYMSGKNDWFVESVYLDAKWIEEEENFYSYMVDADWISKKQAKLPRFDPLRPKG